MYGEKGWLYMAVRDFAWLIQGRHAVVFGAIQNTVESLALAAGAARVTVVEYVKTEYEHSAIDSVLMEDVEGNYWGRTGAASSREKGNSSSESTNTVAGVLDGQVDVAFAIASFDHDGLGRYGDPLCPDCDLMDMDLLREQ